MGERLIDPVKNNIEKYYTYREYINRYNRAMHEGFFFEAILIDYAMMQDRLRSFLYHMGALNTRKSEKIDVKSVKKTLSCLVDNYASKKEAKNLGINSITGKLKIIRCAIEWACKTTSELMKQKYETLLKKQLEGIDIGWLQQTLIEVEAWCKYRNEVIHCLLNKNIMSVDSKIETEAQRGYRLARELDTHVRAFKKGSVLRRKMKLNVEKAVKVEKGGN